MSKALVKDGRPVVSGGRPALDSCADCCCRTYWQLIPCVLDPLGPCGVGAGVPDPIYLWTGAECEDGPITQNRTVFLDGRCWVVSTHVTYNDRNSNPDECPEPRVPIGARVFDDAVVLCVQDCSAPICVAAAGAYVQILPCGTESPGSPLRYTCRSFLTRCVVVGLRSIPTDISSREVCYKFDPSGPNLDGPPPPDAIFYTQSQVQVWLDDPQYGSTCCQCGGNVFNDNQPECLTGTTNPAYGGTGETCCCGSEDRLRNALVTISTYEEKSVFVSGNTTFEQVVFLESPFTFRNSDCIDGNAQQMPLRQQNKENGVVVFDQPTSIPVNCVGCGGPYQNVFPGVVWDVENQVQTCTTYTAFKSAGQPTLGGQQTGRVTVLIQFPDELGPPCLGGCAGSRVVGKGGLGQPIRGGCAGCNQGSDQGSGGALI